MKQVESCDDGSRAVVGNRMEVVEMVNGMSNGLIKSFDQRVTHNNQGDEGHDRGDNDGRVDIEQGAREVV